MDEWLDCFKFFNDPILAKKHFKNFYNNVGYPISLSRGAYWMARTYEKQVIKLKQINGIKKLLIF